MTSSVVIASRWWTHVSTMGGALEALGFGWGRGAVATNPWTCNGFWSTIGGDPCGSKLGWAWFVVLVEC